MVKAALFGDFRIYPRGFLGALQAPTLVAKPKQGDMLTTSGLSAILDSNDSSTVTANAAIELLYNRLLHKDLLVTSFEFRNEIYREVFRAFGNHDFEGWYLAQFQSPAFGELHRDFLDDCLHFVMTGKRRISLTTWDALITLNDQPIRSMDLSDDANAYFGKRSVRQLSPYGKNSLVDIVQNWIAQPGGTSDLLHSCHILFGLAPR